VIPEPDDEPPVYANTAVGTNIAIAKTINPNATILGMISSSFSRFDERVQEL
jgi:hypothetical protein